MAIDITVSADLQEMFAIPPCSEIGLPLPPPIPLQVTLPGGASLQAFSDLSKGIPTDCAMTFSLFMQLAPFLASIECLVKVLNLIQTAVNALQSIKTPMDLLSAVQNIVKAATPVVNCALSFTPAGLIPFIRDLLCLILKALKCFKSQLGSVVNTLIDIESAIKQALSSNNLALLASLQCAQNNAGTQAQYMMNSLAPLGVVLDLAGDLMKIVGIGPIKLPATAGVTTEVTALQDLLTAVDKVVAILQTATETLGGC
jgi:hypothetical protein